MLASHLIETAINEHLKWLSTFGNGRVNNFKKLYRNNREGAVCEALVAQYLQANLDNLEPYEDWSVGGPDFRCTSAGRHFYVEVTSLNTKSVERASWIPDDPKWKGGAVGSMSQIMRTSVSDKVEQCAAMDAPTLVALGILHSWVSNGIGDGTARDMLISDESYVVSVSPADPVPTKPGEFVTGLHNAMFMAIAEDKIAIKRESIAGVMVFGLGVRPPRIVGIINAAVHRPFDPGWLPLIPFAEATVNDNKVSLRWHNKT